MSMHHNKRVNANNNTQLHGHKQLQQHQQFRRPRYPIQQSQDYVQYRPQNNHNGRIFVSQQHTMNPHGRYINNNRSSSKNNSPSSSSSSFNHNNRSNNSTTPATASTQPQTRQTIYTTPQQQQQQLNNNGSSSINNVSVASTKSTSSIEFSSYGQTVNSNPPNGQYYHNDDDEKHDPLSSPRYLQKSIEKPTFFTTTCSESSSTTSSTQSTSLNGSVSSSEMYYKYQNNVGVNSNEYIVEEHIPTTQQCNQNHLPAHAQFSLSSISSLLPYISPGSIVVFDIDDTLIRRSNTESSLLTQHGTNMMVTYLQSPACNALSYDEKHLLIRELNTHLRTFVAAEPETTNVVHQLQQLGCYVFALTARSSQISTMTNATLKQLNIDFTKSLPPNMPLQAIEPITNAVVIDGVIYCNDAPKGVVFQRFMAQQWISFPVLHECHQVSCQFDPTCTQNNKVVSSTSVVRNHHEAMQCPQRTVWFVDDSFPMLQSMIQQWQFHAEKQLDFYSSLQPSLQQQMPCQGKMALVCCHYTHPTAAAATPIDNQGVLEQVIAVQISSFIKNKVVLSDKQAIDILSASPTWSNSGNSTPQTALSYTGSHRSSPSSQCDDNGYDDSVGVNNNGPAMSQCSHDSALSAVA